MFISSLKSTALATQIPNTGSSDSFVKSPTARRYICRCSHYPGFPRSLCWRFAHPPTPGVLAALKAARPSATLFISRCPLPPAGSLRNCLLHSWLEHVSLETQAPSFLRLVPHHYPPPTSVCTGRSKTEHKCLFHQKRDKGQLTTTQRRGRAFGVSRTSIKGKLCV